MTMMRSLLILAVLPIGTLAHAADFVPDPYSVQRHGPAYRYPQAGWIVLHVEGEPYERGVQHGRLLAPEIAAYIRCFAATQSATAPADGWQLTRTLVNALFLRRFDREYLEEMKGIADGAAAVGAKFGDRPVDLLDIVCLNCWAEVETLDGALDATPTGLEGVRFPKEKHQPAPAAQPEHCSAFAATGPATADGKIVFGHITMFSLYPSQHFNIWLDLRPAKGHRILMQTFPGGIQSGMDYYMNGAGILVCETTIKQTRFNGQGQTVASRIRKALQTCDSIDAVVEVLKTASNGLYTNEWLLADTKTNEIAMFELGTTKTKLWRSSKNEWYGGTAGFYWGCNNVKDLDVRLDAVASVEGRPQNVVWRPSDRDKTWLKLFEKHRGKIGVEFGKEAFTTPPLAASHALDAKFTTTDLARDLKTWALFGPPLGRTWLPTDEEKKNYPEIRPLVSNPWTVLQAQSPVEPQKPFLAADLREKIQTKEKEDEKLPPTKPAWHGTLLPKTDGDIWLAASFAEYEKIVALEKTLEQMKDGKAEEKGGEEAYSPSLLASHLQQGRSSDLEEERDRLAIELFGYRSAYLASGRAGKEVPLMETRSQFGDEFWYRYASGKGVWLLHDLRKHMSDKEFQELMDSFGRVHAGKPVTTDLFRNHVDKTHREKLNGFWERWLQIKSLPRFRLANITGQAGFNVGNILGPFPDLIPFKGPFIEVQGDIVQDRPVMSGGVVEVTVEHSGLETTRPVQLTGARTKFIIWLSAIKSKEKVVAILDKYGTTPKSNGGAYSILSFNAELDQCLIVAGTSDETAANREAAESLQRAIRERWSNYTMPIKADTEVTDDDLKQHHLLLIGRPDCNKVVERFKTAIPITFGSRSFTVRGETYAHSRSAVIAAGENPANARYSLVMIAGLSAEATCQAAPLLMKKDQKPAEVLVLPHGGRPRPLVIPAPELVVEVKPGNGK
jgi:hypothetical protein